MVKRDLKIQICLGINFPYLVKELISILVAIDVNFQPACAWWGPKFISEELDMNDIDVLTAIPQSQHRIEQGKIKEGRKTNPQTKTKGNLQL